MNKIKLALVKRAIVSEKSTRLNSESGQYVFCVGREAKKEGIKQAIEFAFNVRVDRVNVLNVKGKYKRFGRFVGQRQDWKKVYVTLKPGFSIDVSAA